MIPKEYRLKKRKAFNATYKIGLSHHLAGLTVFCGRTQKDEKKAINTKVGFVVSKKINKRAVKRNRIKRLMRESYRLAIKNKLTSNKYISLIFVASTKLQNKDFNYINEALIALLGKI